MSSGGVRPAPGGTVLAPQVSPKARITALRGFYGEKALELPVAAPPSKGRANAETERYPAAAVGVQGASPEEVRERVSGAA